MSTNILDAFHGVKKSGDGWTARCPVHDDQRSSLSISRGEIQAWVRNCHAGCEKESIVAAAGLEMADILKPRETTTTRSRIGCTYDYTDEQGSLLYQVVRMDVMKAIHEWRVLPEQRKLDLRIAEQRRQRQRMGRKG